jgi:hypothetical protein
MPGAERKDGLILDLGDGGCIPRILQVGNMQQVHSFGYRCVTCEQFWLYVGNS